MARRPSIESRLTAVERGIRSLHATDMAIIKEMRDGFAQMESLFAHMESRLDQIYNHITHNPVSVVRFLLSEAARAGLSRMQSQTPGLPGSIKGVRREATGGKLDKSAQG